MALKKHKPTVKYLLSDITDPDLRSRLEHKFIEFETLKRLNVEAQRASMRAEANARKSTSEVQLSQLDFLIEAGEAFDLINTEPMWMIRRQGNGEVVLECLLTESDMQQLARAQTNQVKEQLSELHDSSNEDEDDTDMFKT